MATALNAIKIVADKKNVFLILINVAFLFFIPHLSTPSSIGTILVYRSQKIEFAFSLVANYIT